MRRWYENKNCNHPYTFALNSDTLGSGITHLCQSMIRFENATKQFSENSIGLKEVSFILEPGEFIFLTGPSGSGKTTLIKLILREYQLTSGDIFFHDTQLRTLSSSKVHLHRRKIGVVFQDYKLIQEMNVWENIALPLFVIGKPYAEIEQRVSDLLNLIKLPDKVNLFPSQLSGGEAQRVSIARALASGPEVIIADEPTGNLDPETAIGIVRLMHKINSLGTTVLIATHDRSIIAQFTEARTLKLEKGSLVTDTQKKKPAENPPQKLDKKTEEPAAEKQSEPEEKKEKRPSLWKRMFGKKPKKAAASSTLETDTAGSEPAEVKSISIDEPKETKSEEKAKPASKKKKQKVVEESES